MKRCSLCGGQVEDDDIYCGYCGNQLRPNPPRGSYNKKQDFEEVTSTKDDFDHGFDNDFDSDFDADFDKDIDGNFAKDPDSEVVKDDEFSKKDVEFESYVEHNTPFGKASSSTTRNSSQGHKSLRYNKYANDANTCGIVALILGILGGFLGIVFGIIGISNANKALALCNTGEYDGKSKAKNGKTLSIIGIVFGVIGSFRVFTLLTSIFSL